MSKMDELTDRVEQDRADLAASLDALTNAVAPEQVATQVSTSATKLTSDLAEKAWSTVRENPAGGIMTAIGVALMAAGQGRTAQPAPQPSAHPTAVPPDQAFAGFDARVAQADTEIRREMTGELPERASSSKLRAALQDGLDKLPRQSRQRILEARHSALRAQEAVERRTREAARKAKGFAYEQPLVVGAVAIGLGLALGSLLPGTRREDQLLGERRDALMDRAQSVMDHELRRARIYAEDTLSDATRRAAG